jgi:hypothetical protein
MRLTYQPSLTSDPVVLFDGTATAPMGRYISPVYDDPAADRGVVVPMPERRGRCAAKPGGRFLRPEGDAA